ncbi:hypothetical protein J3B02_001097 [Coemansia erecta]|nr:hypothetical protein J3B02_001097 [Coemansia erecta]
MRYIAAYLLAQLANPEATPSNDAITKIISSVGIEVDADRLSQLQAALEGKGINELIAEGQSKLASVPSGGAAPAAGAAAGGAAAAAPAAEEKEEEEEDSDEDMGFEDSKGIVHPIITVTLNRPVPVSNISDQILELPDVYISSTANAAISESDPAAAGADKNSTSNPNIAKVILNTSDSGSPAQIARSECTGNEIKIESRRENDAQETQVIMQLQADQFFFGQLIRYIERSQEFEKTYTKQYSTNVTALGSELTAVTSPYKRDFEIWRELFRLYIDADVWEHTEGDFRPTNTAKEGQERFAKFMQHVDKIGLTKRFCDPLSLNLLVNFFKLNSELTNLKLLQEMNELAMRKILKKHDKRTQLVSKTQFPQFVTIDTTTLTKALIYTIHTELVGVVPQIDDYLCPMCLNIAWRPLRLDCAHVFCSRCVVKASRRCIFDCPVCRAKNAIYRAGVSNIDNALLNFLKLYFPREVKEKQRDIQQEISHEETRAIVAAHARERPCLIM